MHIIRDAKKRKAEKNCKSVVDGFNSQGNYITYVTAYTKEKFPILVRHTQYSNGDGTLSKRGKYHLLNITEEIGYLKYVYYPEDTEKECHIILADIKINPQYRNQGLGSAVLMLFENRAFEYGCKYITGKLSDVDAETDADRLLRDEFYKKHAYQINEGEVVKKLSR